MSWLRDLFGDPGDDEELKKSGREVMKRYETATPAEREEFHGKIKVFAKILGVDEKYIDELEKSLGPTGGPISEKTAALAKLRRAYEAALAKTEDPGDREDIKTLFDIERRKIIES
jgi:hypothetical protein